MILSVKFRKGSKAVARAVRVGQRVYIGSRRCGQFYYISSEWLFGLDGRERELITF